ncbi:hypothetical protein ABZZ17_32790 [Streptomyces sp. NPDC006512]|uniref:hypothetical protein n=1 Tax=Streptomyces sp. NPDC006512 TaxID=3154307 RepID=UPI0033B2573C
MGLEDYHYRNDPKLMPAVWKKPYDALPADPGRIKGYDGDRVGGTVLDREARAGNAVVWTCAGKQAAALWGRGTGCGARVTGHRARVTGMVI